MACQTYGRRSFRRMRVKTKESAIPEGIASETGEVFRSVTVPVLVFCFVQRGERGRNTCRIDVSPYLETVAMQSLVWHVACLTDRHNRSFN